MIICLLLKCALFFVQLSLNAHFNYRIFLNILDMLRTEAKHSTLMVCKKYYVFHFAAMLIESKLKLKIAWFLPDNSFPILSNEKPVFIPCDWVLFHMVFHPSSPTFLVERVIFL